MTAPLPALLAKIVSPEQGGFLTLEDIRALATLDRNRQILIRCGACRMVVSADSVEHVCGIIDASETDYVRDVALLSSDPAFAPAPKPAPPLPKRPQPVACWNYEADTYDCFSDADPGL